MYNKFNFNFVEKTIVGSKRSIERANKGLKPEFEELSKMLEAQPTFKVVVKQINAKEGKDTHKGLTYKRMESFINLLDNRDELLSKYDAVKEVGEVCGSAYPSTKKWFLDTFPQFRTAKTDEEQKDFDARTAAIVNEIARREKVRTIEDEAKVA